MISLFYFSVIFLNIIYCSCIRFIFIKSLRDIPVVRKYFKYTCVIGYFIKVLSRYLCVRAIFIYSKIFKKSFYFIFLSILSNLTIVK